MGALLRWVAGVERLTPRTTVSWSVPTEGVLMARAVTAISSPSIWIVK
jgi:hypothetical protein